MYYARHTRVCASVRREQGRGGSQKEAAAVPHRSRAAACSFCSPDSRERHVAYMVQGPCCMLSHRRRALWSDSAQTPNVHDVPWHVCSRRGLMWLMSSGTLVAMARINGSHQWLASDWRQRVIRARQLWPLALSHAREIKTDFVTNHRRMLVRPRHISFVTVRLGHISLQPMLLAARAHGRVAV